MVVVLDDMPEIGEHFLCRFDELLVMYKVLRLDGRLLKLSDLFKTALSLRNKKLLKPLPCQNGFKCCFKCSLFR